MKFCNFEKKKEKKLDFSATNVAKIPLYVKNLPVCTKKTTNLPRDMQPEDCLVFMFVSARGQFNDVCSVPPG